MPQTSASMDLLEELVHEHILAVDEYRERALEKLCEDHPEIAEELRACVDKLGRFEHRHSSPIDIVEPEDLDPTPQVSVRYQPLDKIAQGGMGEIWSAHDAQLEREVAMKILPRRPLAPQAGDSLTSAMALRDAARFREEARIMGQLDHPGVLPVYEIDRDDEGRTFFTMPVVRGEILHDVFDQALAGSDTWTERRCVEILVKVCETLAYAHSRGILHRDLKPANIMVGQFGQVYVMDWGIAKVVGEKDSRDLRPLDLEDESAFQSGGPVQTVDGTVIGTPSYMAPEQAVTGKQITFAADVYAVGAMLYELLAGDPPYALGTPPPRPYEILKRVRKGPPTPVEQIYTKAPPELVSICVKAMQREPGRRYATIADLGEDLRAYLNGNVVAAHRTGALAEAHKWTKRNRRLATVIAISVIYLVAMGAFFFHRLVQEWDANEKLGQQASERETMLNYQLSVERIRKLRTAARTELWPLGPDKRIALGQWIDQASRMRDQLAKVRIELAQMREESIITSPSAQGSPVDPAGRIEEKDLRTMFEVYERVEAVLGSFFEGPEYGMEGTSFVEVERRLEALDRATRDSSDPPRPLPSWNEAIRSVQRLPLYRGLELTPNPLLVPLGRDPDSGLWEFAHGLTGETPRRDRSGALQLSASSAVVLVLIPGGRGVMGPQSPREQDTIAEHTETPVHQMSLRAYLIAKHELTQAQWRRLRGTSGALEERQSIARESGARDVARDELHPIAQVTWQECHDTLARFSLDLPTEAQWEHACRAGSTHPWSIARTQGTLRQVAAVDRPGTSPVGSFPKNRYGLHDMHGNLFEWCKDPWWPTYDPGTREGDGYRLVPRETGNRVLRGGSFLGGPKEARSASRRWSGSAFRFDDFGVRPALNL